MCRPISWITHIVSAVGAINWGLLRFFSFDIVEYIENVTMVAKVGDVLYAAIAICGIFSLVTLLTPKKVCG
jgi:uncharacterized membrane protein YuzA (DUF378 family)